MSATPLLAEAQRYAEAGVSIIPVGHDKRPFGPWTRSQQEVTSPEKLAAQFNSPHVTGYAAVTGRVSGGLVCFDIDPDKKREALSPVDPDAVLNEFLEAVSGIIDMSTLPVFQTGSGGYHVYIRCSEPGSNTKLAGVPASNWQGVHYIVETRAEHGYALLPGSQHPSGGAYIRLQGDITDAPMLTQEQHEAFLRAARTLDRMPLKAEEKRRLVRNYQQRQGGQNEVIKAFNKRYDPADILERNGYELVKDKYRSPDSTSGNAGVTVFEDAGLVYSHHGDALGDGQAHDAFDVFALLECGGDKKQAYREAAQKLELWQNSAPGLDVQGEASKDKATQEAATTKSKQAVALITRMSDIEPQDVSWLWHPYIPIGKLTLLEGDPGLGKTFISLTLAAAITRGWPLLSQTGAPGEELEPADVLYMSAEDGLADTLRPRLDAADADVSRVHALTGWHLTDGGKTVEGAVSLGDIPVLEQALERTRAKLIIIDPLQAYLGAGVDMHRANEVRPLLSALGNLAEKRGCAVVCIRHLSKAMSPKAIYSGMGSIDFAAAARSILTVGEHEGERLLAHVKSSLAPQGKSIRYELKDGSLNWLGVSDVTAEELRLPPQREEGESTVDSGVTFLQSFLADGPQAANTTFKAAKQEGISERTLRRAKAQLGVKSQRASAGNEGKGKWLWSLPNNTGTLAPLQAKPATDAHPARVPEIPLELLQKERERHEKLQAGKGATYLPLEPDDLSDLIGTFEGEL